MDIRKAKKNSLPAICETVSMRLSSSVEASYTLDGISDKYGLIYQYMYPQLECWMRIGEIWVIGENKGMLAGHFRKSNNIFASSRSTI